MGHERTLSFLFPHGVQSLGGCPVFTILRQAYGLEAVE